MTPLDEFVLCCGRTDLAGTTLARARELACQGLDWTALLRHRAAGEILPLLHHNLEQIDREGMVPRDVLDKLARAREATRQRNQSILSEFLAIQSELDRRGVPVMLLKGLGLAVGAYGGLSRRGMGDIDLLVREQDSRAVGGTLAGLDYLLAFRIPELEPAALVEYAHCFGQLRFHAQGKVPVETHFRLINVGPPEARETAWDGAESLTIGGASVLVPSPADNLLHLCIHANVHNFSNLRLFCDIAAHLDSQGGRIDWDAFVRRVAARRMQAAIWATLHLTRRLLGVGAPAAIERALRPGRGRARLHAWAWNWPQVLALRAAAKYSRQEGPRFYLLEVDGPRQKLSFLRRSLFPPRSWLASYYGQNGSPGLYLKRWLGHA